jgi:putative ABC transport system permease protein
VGLVVVETLPIFFPRLPVEFSLPYALAAEFVAVLIGLLAGVLPAQKAAGMDPVEALRAE